jgi:hypothetical protein
LLDLLKQHPAIRNDEVDSDKLDCASRYHHDPTVHLVGLHIILSIIRVVADYPELFDTRLGLN